MRMAGGAAVIAAAMLLTSDVLAGKPGGGTPPAPTGTIYFRDQASGDGFYPYYLLDSMDGNGGNRAVVMRTHLAVHASRKLHGGRRWLLTMEEIADEAGPGGRVRLEVFAVREDGALHVRLTGRPAMEYWKAEWAPDEDANGATVSMLGRQWTGLSSSDTVVDGTWGLYTAHLTFDGDGNVVGLDADPVFAVSLGTAFFNGGLQEMPDVSSYSWSPDMTRLAADNYGGTQIRVVDVASGAVVPLGSGANPDWSPDGSKIAYRGNVVTKKAYKYALQTVRPDGTGVTTVLSVAVSWPRWSPDGAYIAYTYGSDRNYVYRVRADGSGSTNLTPDATGGPSGGFVLIDWR
jgi:hypothetical protein